MSGVLGLFRCKISVFGHDLLMSYFYVFIRRSNSVVSEMWLVCLCLAQLPGDDGSISVVTATLEESRPTFDPDSYGALS